MKNKGLVWSLRPKHQKRMNLNNGIVVAGLSSGLVPIYISEISPTEWRGACGTFVHLLIIVGVLVAEVNIHTL